MKNLLTILKIVVSSQAIDENRRINYNWTTYDNTHSWQHWELAKD
jgi:hypothetical protein